jgi:hypothetical protein
MHGNSSDRRALEREALRNVINQWNANRLDLFELSEPNEVNDNLVFYYIYSHNHVKKKSENDNVRLIKAPFSLRCNGELDPISDVALRHCLCWRLQVVWQDKITINSIWIGRWFVQEVVIMTQECSISSVIQYGWMNLDNTPWVLPRAGPINRPCLPFHISLTGARSSLHYLSVNIDWFLEIILSTGVQLVCECFTTTTAWEKQSQP